MPEEWCDKFMYGFGEELRFADETFDAVTSWYVLEHVNDWKKCIQEMLRVAKVGGTICINAPDYNNSYEEHYLVDFNKPLKEHKNEFKKYLLKNDYKLDTFNELNFISNSDVYGVLKEYGLDKLTIVDNNLSKPRVKSKKGILYKEDRIDLRITKLG